MEAYLVTHFLAVTLMFGLAGWLLWLDFESRVNRAFALFLVLRGMFTLSNRMTEAAGGTWSPVWAALSQYFFIALPLALGYFLLVHLGSRARSRALVGFSLLVVAVVAETAYLLDHCLARCVLEDGTRWFGPLYLLGASLAAVFTIAGISVTRHGASSASDGRRDGSFLLACAFLLEGLLTPSIGVANLLRGGLPGILAQQEPDAVALAYQGMLVATFALALGGVVLLVRTILLKGGPRLAATVATLCALAVGAGMFVSFSSDALYPTAAFLVGLLLMVPPALVAYAVLRHSLFDLDVKVKWTLAKTPAAVLALATFFVVTQVAETYFSTSLGALVGGLVTGILVLALSPLHTLGQRLADGMMPGTKPIQAMSHPERVELYRTQASLAWRDGWLAAKERLLLDHLRDRLGLSLEEATRLEREAMNVQNPPLEGGAA